MMSRSPSPWWSDTKRTKDMSNSDNVKVESFHQFLWKPLSSSRQPCSSCSLSPDQLDQLGKHGTPHRPRDQPSDATGGKSHVDLALITKSDDTSLHQELSLLNSSLGCLTVPRSRSLSDIVHVAGDPSESTGRLIVEELSKQSSN